MSSMLYQFHTNQNAKKPGSVHATFLISGIQAPKANVSGTTIEVYDDVHMQSSPFMSSSIPQQDAEEDVRLLKVMTLVQEEHLDCMFNRFHLQAWRCILISLASRERAVQISIIYSCL